MTQNAHFLSLAITVTFSLTAAIPVFQAPEVFNASSASAQFNFDSTYRYLEFTRASYCVRDDLSIWNCSVCNDKISGFQIDFVTPTNVLTQVQAYTGYDPTADTIMVAFRGSQHIVNWIHNIRLAMIDGDYDDCPADDPCKVHQGFLDGYKSVKDGIAASALKLKLRHPSAPIVVTGHSLGGALATFCALDLVVERGVAAADVRLITFGAPRIGNRAFAEFAQSTLAAGGVQRVTHRRDVVPRLPPSEREIASFAYFHAAQELWFDDDADVRSHRACSATDGEDPACINSVLSLLLSAADHGVYLGVQVSGCPDPQPMF